MSSIFNLPPEFTSKHTLKHCGICKKKLTHKIQILNGREFYQCLGMKHQEKLDLQLEEIKKANEISELDNKYQLQLKEME